MRKEMRRLARVANAILDRFTDLRSRDQSNILTHLSCLLDRMKYLQGSHRRLSHCHKRGFSGTAARLTQRIDRMLRELRVELENATAAVCPRRAPLPSLGDLIKDLQQLEDEFGEWRYEASYSRLIVATDAIELEDIYLGPFEIWLEFDSLTDPNWYRMYRIVALDAHPASSDHGVTHPHVSGERLCAGDASVPIQSALQDGRICDFFLLVRSVLQTYNVHSPHVALADWYGVSCYECGTLMDDDGRYMCERCERDFCSECASYCRRCDCTICSGCMTQCEVCEDSYCPACIGECDDCGRVICEGCQEDGRCPDCLAAEEEEDEQEDEEEAKEELVAGAGTQETVTGAEVHADGVGQTPVLLPSRQD